MKKVERSPRRHLIYMVRVKSSEGKHFTGRLVDISGNGMKMLTKEKVFIGDTYHIEIIIPEKTDDSSEIICNGTTIWYKRHQNPERYSAGFEIKGVDEKNQAGLDKLINSFMG